MRFLSQTRQADTDRRFRQRKRAKGLCIRCPRSTSGGFATCPECRDAMKRTIRIWRTK